MDTTIPALPSVPRVPQSGPKPPPPRERGAESKCGAPLACLRRLKILGQIRDALDQGPG